MKFSLPLLSLCSAAVFVSAAPAAENLAPAPSPWRVTDKVQPRVELFRLEEVRLGDGPFLDAQKRDAKYLLELSADRLLHGFRRNAGLPPKAPHYGGWESLGLEGHSLGHYLSACAMMYASTGDERFRERVRYIVSELATCQTPARGGLVSGFPDDEKIFKQVEAGELHVERWSLNGGWVPWYNLHKTFAGLRDAYLFAHDEQALAVLKRLGEWTGNITRNLSDDQFQQMLRAEHGGMYESIADLYALTGDEKFLQLARRFYHHEVLDPLAQHRDELTGLHANTQIPKLVGAARMYELTGEAKDHEAAQFFWDTVVSHRSWVIGGNSESEHFFPPETASTHLTGSTAETCNTYNMLRLTEHLYTWEPKAAYFDFFERALYNHILASQDPETGMCTYFVSLRPGAFKYYHDPENAFWCCTGTGMENHAKYARGIYAHAPGELYVNLFIASTLHWRETGVTLTQTADLPDSPKVRFTLGLSSPTRFALKLRVPGWIAGAPTLQINGRPEKVSAGPASYLTLDREWRNGDVVELALPMALHTEALPYSEKMYAVMYGPVVLAGELGAADLKQDAFIKPGENDYRTAVPPVAPVWVADNLASAVAHIEAVPGKPATFRTRDMAHPRDVTLIPFYRLHRERHVVYWSLFTPAQWQRESTARTEAAIREQALAARTVDSLVCTEQQLEIGHAFRSEKSDVNFLLGTNGRVARAGGWFEYELTVAPDQSAELLCRWWGEDVGRTAELLVDGVVVASPKIEGAKQAAPIEATYVIPAELLRGKTKVVVRIRGTAAEPSPRLLQLRTLRP
jgi:DUF1680 family protein